MIKTIIIEDESNARDVLKKMLGLLCPSINIVGETGNVQDAISLINNLKPQLVFLDIELENGTGFEVLQQIETRDFKTIFTTAYNKYAIKAFKFSAIDYLLKPIDPEELQNAVERASTIIGEQDNYQELLSRMTKEKEENIVLKTSQQKHLIQLSSIIRLEADGAYTTFVTEKEKLIVSKNLKYYQEILGYNFLRCHQSHLVQKHHIIRIENNAIVHLSNLDTVPISRRYKSTFSNNLNQI